MILNDEYGVMQAVLAPQHLNPSTQPNPNPPWRDPPRYSRNHEKRPDYPPSLQPNPELREGSCWRVHHGIYSPFSIAPTPHGRRSSIINSIHLHIHTCYIHLHHHHHHPLILAVTIPPRRRRSPRVVSLIRSCPHQSSTLSQVVPWKKGVRINGGDIQQAYKKYFSV